MLYDLYKQLQVVWQPIMDLHSGTPWGYEAMIRGPAGSVYETSGALFELARHEGLDQEFEEVCRLLAFRAAVKDLPRSAMLFVHADPRFVDLPLAPRELDWPAAHTVIEISEGSPLFAHPEVLQSELGTWRVQGYRIAFSGFGTGFAGPTALLAARPDMVKIDQVLVHNIDRDPWRQEMLSSIVHAASDLGVAVVAEGIEAVAELNELVARRITLGQGTLLGRAVPGSQIAESTQSCLHARQGASDILASNMPTDGAAYAVDRARRIVAWNEDAVALTGYRPEAVVGTACWLSGLDHSDISGSRLCFRACPLVRAMQTGKPQSGVVSLRTAGGARKWVLTRARPVTDDGGEVVGAVETLVRTQRPETEHGRLMRNTSSTAGRSRIDPHKLEAAQPRSRPQTVSLLGKDR